MELNIETSLGLSLGSHGNRDAAISTSVVNEDELSTILRIRKIRSEVN